MVDMTIKAVRQAELSAAKTEKEALAKKEAMLEQAQLEIVKKREDMFRKAAEAHKEAVKQAELQCETFMEQAMKEAEDEIRLLKKQVGEKQAEASKRILAKLV